MNEYFPLEKGGLVVIDLLLYNNKKQKIFKPQHHTIMDVPTKDRKTT